MHEQKMFSHGLREHDVNKFSFLQILLEFQVHIWNSIANSIPREKPTQP